ncbi:metalloregulator ArsR/SmtB family transcription factor [Paracoccus sp. (in: a-proteobacteria)]|uniref:metalloregulator ArsR/SmtB family transcription factor n=1 Tax=Paracoccus sp. TaxID=267 RepID=UPI003A84A6E9
MNNALDCFAALSQSMRLSVFRLLVRAGQGGMAAGQIAGALDVRENTLSANLSVLASAGLVQRRREGRSIRYFADLTTMRHLVDYLFSDCCGGNPAICRPVINTQILLPIPETSWTTQMREPPFNVLFLCTANSARSLIAEAILNADPSGRFRAFSAGSQPAGQPNPHTVRLLARLGHDLTGIRSKSWDEFAGPDAPQMDFVFTVCDNAAGEVCPVWPGHPVTAHWGIPDPAAVGGNEAEQAAAFNRAHQMLATRLAAFTSLPLESLERSALKVQMDEIGNDMTTA